MPKANSIHNTLASGLNRRGLLVGGATALAVSATLPALAAQSQCSAEFREWYAMAKTWPDVLRSVTPWEHANPGKDHELSPDARFNEALGKLEDIIFARPVRSQTDIDELAIIALFWSDSDEDPSEFLIGNDPGVESPCRDDRAQAHLLQAVATPAMQRLGIGGAHV